MKRYVFSLSLSLLLSAAAYKLQQFSLLLREIQEENPTLDLT